MYSYYSYVLVSLGRFGYQFESNKNIKVPKTTGPWCGKQPWSVDGWLQTAGVSTNGVSAKEMNSDRLGKKVRTINRC